MRCSAWPGSAQAAAGSGPPRRDVAINVSAAELRDRDFVQCMREILEETGLPPAHLELELRETVLIQEAPFALDVLRLSAGPGLLFRRAVERRGVRAALSPRHHNPRRSSERNLRSRERLVYRSTQLLARA
jgi:hypothetical protein